MLACAGLLAMYSSGYDHGTRFADHGRNMLIAGAISVHGGPGAAPKYHGLVPCRCMPHRRGAAGGGGAVWHHQKGGDALDQHGRHVIQPSEILKIAMPLMLAWWFQKREGALRPLDFAAAGLLLAIPVGLS